MQKINFSMFVNDNPVINEEIKCISSNEKINFIHNKEKYKLNITSDKFNFSKENDESVLILKKENNNYFGYITFKEINNTYDLNIIDCEYIYTDEMFSFKYKIDGDSDTKKIIIKIC